MRFTLALGTIACLPLAADGVLACEWFTCTLFIAALDTAFSSLYRDEVHLASEHIRATIAAATMLQMVCHFYRLLCIASIML